MAIKLNFAKSDADDLTGRSKMWGCPDLPDTLEYPEIAVDDDGEMVDDPLTFICQIRCSDLKAVDPEGRLPHEGMLYFFGALDYFQGNLDALANPGMGDWDPRCFKVLYTSDCDNLHTHKIVFDDGTPFGLPAEGISFSVCPDREDGFKLLGAPFFEEICELYPGMTSLLQLDCSDEWNLQFYDCGMVCFLISAVDLAQKRFDKTICYLHSF